jgi:hypothetical protein
MASNNIFEHGNVVSVLVPADLQTKVTADWIDMSDYHSVDFIFFKAVGTAADDPDVHVTQATSNAGAGEKGLAISEYYLKQGTLLSTSSIGGQFTKTTQTASYVISFDGDSAEQQLLCGIHVEADQLDVTGGFRWLSVNVPDVGGNAQIGGIVAVMHPSRYQQEQTPNPL